MVWKPVKGFEGRYSVSNTGKIYSWYIKRVMKTYLNNNGYEMIDLANDGKKYKFTVHRLVAYHFCNGYKPGLHVNHIDSNRLNNNASNLEWVTVRENIQDMINRGTFDVITAQKVAQIKNKKPVAMINENGKVVNIFSSAKEAEEKTGSRSSKISLVCNGHRKTTNGYTWRFIRDKEIV